MRLDPRKLKDWQIAEIAEESMKPIARIAKNAGILADELIPMGKNLAKVDFKKIFERLQNARWAKARPPPPWAWWKVSAR